MLALKYNHTSQFLNKPSTIQHRKHIRTTKCSYDSKLQQKYKIMYHINLCDKFLKTNYDKALTICDVNKSIELQPECKESWRQLESYAIIRNELKIQLQHLDDQLAEYE